jgi:hypothetical protein
MANLLSQWTNTRRALLAFVQEPFGQTAFSVPVALVGRMGSFSGQ